MLQVAKHRVGLKLVNDTWAGTRRSGFILERRLQPHFSFYRWDRKSSAATCSSATHATTARPAATDSAASSAKSAAPPAASAAQSDAAHATTTQTFTA